MTGAVDALRAAPRSARTGLADWSPRDPPAAVRWATILFVAAGLITAERCLIALALLGTLESDGTSPTPAEALWFNAVGLPLLLALGWWTHRAGVRSSWAIGWPPTLGSIGLLPAVNLVHRDASAGRQLFALFPHHLRRVPAAPVPAVSVAAAASASSVITTATMRPGGLRESGVVYFVLTITCITTMIVRAREAAAETEAQLCAPTPAIPTRCAGWAATSSCC